MKFGVREIVDVVFKAADNMTIGTKSFKKYQPVFMIDTATTSSLEQSTTTVYAQGGKGYNRLIAWEGEKTMTFTVTDALMSPMGLAVLTGAGLIKPNKEKQAHMHTTINATTDANGVATVTLDDLNEDFGLQAEDYVICAADDLKIYATELDGSGAGIDWYDDVTVAGGDSNEAGYVHVVEGAPATFTVKKSDVAAEEALAKNITVQLDFYTIFNRGMTEVHIEPSSFGGYFYVEAQTLFRREDTGKDMAAEITITKATVKSAFTFTMAASGEPSTFDFVMDALPGYTRFDHTKKQMCVIQIVGEDKAGKSEDTAHTHQTPTTEFSPSYSDDPEPVDPTTFDTSVAVVSDNAPTLDADMKANQAKATVTKSTADKTDTIVVSIAGGTDTLVEVVPPNTDWPSSKWVALDYNTGESTIEGITYTNTAQGQTAVLGAEDIADATALGLPAGHMVVWVRAEGVLPAIFSLSKGDKTVNVSINMVDGE